VFSPDQAMVYSAVLNAQQQAIAKVAPGATWGQLNQVANTQLLISLIHNGFLNVSSADNATLTELLFWNVSLVFMPHGLGHFVGLDVHDPVNASVQRTLPLAPRMVLTIEPGLYFNQASFQIAYANPNISRFLNQPRMNSFLSMGGVRIEDTLVVTETGNRVLSAGIPKQIADIEKLMAKRRTTASLSEIVGV